MVDGLADLLVAAEGQVRGGLERTYEIASDAVHLDAEAVGNLSDEDHRRYFATFVGTLMLRFDRYLSAGGADFGADRVRYQQTPMWLSDDEVDEMAERVAGLLKSGYSNPPGGGRSRMLFSTIVFPDSPRTDWGPAA